MYINEIIGEDIYDGFINWEGKEIVSPGDYIIWNSYWFTKDDKIAFIRKKQMEKFGLINVTNGEYVAPIVYEGTLRETSSCKIMIVRRDNGEVLLNTHGKEVSPLYKNIKERGNGIFYVTDFSDNYGVINMYGDEIVKCQPFKIYHDKNGYYVYPSASSPYKDRVYL